MDIFSAKRLSLLFLFSAFLLVGCDSSSQPATNDGLSGDGGFFGGRVALSAEHAVVTAPFNGRGQVHVFQRRSDTWREVATASEEAFEPRGDHFGWSVAVSESFTVMGWPGADEQKGAVYVAATEPWATPTRVTPEDFQPGDRFGSAVAVAGDRLVASATSKDVGEASAAGVVYVFVHDGQTWQQEAKLVASNPEEGSFGRSVAVQENRIVVGAAGAAYVFERASSEWSQVAKLTAANADDAPIGTSVALGDGFVAASSTKHSEGGIVGVGGVHIFEEGTWEEVDVLVHDDATKYDGAGRYIDADGDRVVTQAIYKDEGLGAVYVFERAADGTWAQEAKLVAPERQKSGFFGEDVALDGGRLLVGSPGVNSERGVVYLFEHVGGAWRVVE